MNTPNANQIQKIGKGIIGELKQLVKSLKRTRREEALSHVFQAISLILSLVILIISACALQSANNANKISNDSLENSRYFNQEELRALVVPISVSLTSPLVENVSISVVYSFKNIGKRPASNIKLYEMTNAADIPSSDQPDNWRMDTIEDKQACGGFSEYDGFGIKKYNFKIIYPSSEINNESISINTDFSATAGTLIMEGRQVAAIRGCLEYETFSKKHFTKFCFYSQKGSNFVQCPIYQDFN